MMSDEIKDWKVKAGYKAMSPDEIAKMFMDYLSEYDRLVSGRLPNKGGNMIKYCKRCVMPSTRPNIKFNEDGVCYPCLAAEKQKQTDWSKRWEELEDFCDGYRGMNGDYYDCIIPVSGGKDSYFQTFVMKERMGMNPLLVNVSNFSWTETGWHNLLNMQEAFNVDLQCIHLNPVVCRNLFRQAFFKLGSPTWYFDRAIYAYPLMMAKHLGIPLVVYGEDINYFYGGEHAVETPSALDQMKNDVVKPVPWSEWSVSMKDVNPAIYPDVSDVNPIYMSYFVPWSGYHNMEFARSRGFKTLDDTGEWIREGYLEQYDQIDCKGYLVHPWLKFPKFGHQRVTDVASLWIREGRMKREEAVEHVLADDWKLDPEACKDFLGFTGITKDEFWETVDRFANQDMLEKRDGTWRLKKDVEKNLRGII